MARPHFWYLLRSTEFIDYNLPGSILLLVVGYECPITLLSSSLENTIYLLCLTAITCLLPRRVWKLNSTLPLEVIRIDLIFAVSIISAVQDSHLNYYSVHLQSDPVLLPPFSPHWQHIRKIISASISSVNISLL